MGLTPIKLGLVFTCWGVLVAIFAVFGAPRLQERFGLATTGGRRTAGGGQRPHGPRGPRPGRRHGGRCRDRRGGHWRRPPALMDASASQELWRHARTNIVIVNPAAPRPRPGGVLSVLQDQ